MTDARNGQGTGPPKWSVTCCAGFGNWVHHRAGPLGAVDIPVSGYDGESFTLPIPLRVTPGQALSISVIGIGDFTAYDNRSGCFIARVDGRSN